MTCCVTGSDPRVGGGTPHILRVSLDLGDDDADPHSLLAENNSRDNVLGPPWSLRLPVLVHAADELVSLLAGPAISDRAAGSECKSCSCFAKRGPKTSKNIPLSAGSSYATSSSFTGCA